MDETDMKHFRNDILRVIILGLCLSLFFVTAAFAAVTRNTRFTSASEMMQKLGTTDPGTWNPSYLTEVENAYWSFAPQSYLGSKEITLDMAKNNYRNLEMLLDNGYTLDYNTLSSYCEEYLGKKNGEKDAFYNIMSSCLNNPYLLGRPEATVTGTTYNGRDYSKVFDAAFYQAKHPELGGDSAALLRYFVETGIGNGEQGNASFDVKAYAAAEDAAVLNAQNQSASYRALGAGKSAPLGKYSYSWANYYGKYLGHYTPGVLTAPVKGSDSSTSTAADEVKNGSDTDIDSMMADGAEDNSTPLPKTVASAYKEGSTKSVYTNESVTSAQANTRPLAVMMPTDRAAQPSYGISRADILYEIMEEGGISRQMAIIPNWTDLSRIGNLRSCRLYYIYAAKEWDPILIHFGGVAYMKGVINAPDMNNISGTYEYGVGGKAPGAGQFFRTSDRQAPHNAYISASGIQKACMQQGYLTNLRSGFYNPKHFSFAEGVNDLPGGESATSIDLSEIFPYSKSSFTYNAADGLYYKNIHGGAQKDAINGRQISFANVIIQNTKWSQLDKKGYLGFTMLDSTEDGYFFTRGKCIHIHWKKTGDYSPTKYYDDAGNEIKLNTGKTYIGIAQKGRNPKYS